jgi:hypothetical protein
MSTRFKVDSKYNYGQAPLPTGYEQKYGSSDFFIPSCGIEDVDTAMFSLFDKEISPSYGGVGSTDVKKVPIVFAAGEKWAMLKRNRPLRDKNNTLILPLITIMRTDVNQSMAEDVVGRGINQQVGEIVVKRRLDKSDRNYQSMINRLFLRNQQNLAVRPSDTEDSAQLTTEGVIGDLQNDPTVVAGGLLFNDRLKNLYETIVIPTPQFYTAKYQITIWTQYTQHANQIIEKLFSSFLPQAQSWRLDTPKGYWFVAKYDDGSLAIETSFDDMSQQERFIKHNLTVSVPAYIFASDAPGSPVPIKRYVSAPVISFDFTTITEPSELSGLSTESEYVIGSDDPTLPLDEQKNNRKDQRTPGWRQQKIYPVIDGTDSNDPALRNRRKNFIREIGKTSKGETTYTGYSLGGLKITND